MWIKLAWLNSGHFGCMVLFKYYTCVFLTI